MSGILTANPAGRLDVLAYRLAEHGAERIMPREWPVLAPHVEKLAKKHLGPKALGDLTWIQLLGYSNPFTVGIAPALQPFFETTYGQAILQEGGMLKTPTATKTANAMTPPAPQTANKLNAWTPDDLAETTVQRGIQYKIDSDWFRSLNSSGGSGSSGADGKPKNPTDLDMTWIWVALAAGAVGVILLLRR